MASVLSVGIIMEEAANYRGNVQDRSSLAAEDLGTMYSEQNSLCTGCDETQQTGQQ